MGTLIAIGLVPRPVELIKPGWRAFSVARKNRHRSKLMRFDLSPTLNPISKAQTPDNYISPL